MAAKKRKGPGRPRIEIDNAEAIRLVQTMGATTEDLASWFKCNRATVERRIHEDPDFAADIEKARLECRMSPRASLLKLVREGNVAATIFACKVISGLNETRLLKAEVKDTTGVLRVPVVQSLDDWYEMAQDTTEEAN